MSDELLPEPQLLDLEGLLPFEEALDPESDITRDRSGAFLFIGDGLTADEFTEYVRTYDFGGTPPDFVVLHHTAIPSTMHTRQPTGDVWDGGEEGLTEAQIKQRRKTKLANLRTYYRDTLGWDRGPHLYIDDRYIWLFTPMYDEGIHAMWGNRFDDAAGMHYSIGIEVIGHYEAKPWPPAVARLVGHSVAVLKQKLGTFELTYQYPDPARKPGRKSVGKDRQGRDIWRCAHPERLRAGAISSHRDYNKPQCPGGAVDEAFYIGVLNDAWKRLTEPAQPDDMTAMGLAGAAQHGALQAIGSITRDSTLLGPPPVGLDQCQRYLVKKHRAKAAADGAYSDDDVRWITRLYFETAAPAGLNPVLALAQMAEETDNLTSEWSQPPRRNPAGIGVTGEPGKGLSFPNWATAVRAHVGRLLAYAVAPGTETPAQQALIDEALGLRPLPANLRGAAPSLGGLTGKWAADPKYADKLCDHANALLTFGEG